MSRYRRSQQSGGTYFFTVVAYQRRPILCDDPIRQALKQAINTVRATRPFVIDAWVLQPDHLHCIWTLPEGDADFSSRWRLIKSYVSKACRQQYRQQDLISPSKKKHREGTVWQRRFLEHAIRDEDDFAKHIDYIHHNPVKHGLVDSAAAWPYSTIHRHIKNRLYPPDWSGA
ncbi:Transposase [Oxalobacteraceae bacterium IMCC9480]|nr:Transposase [Oxalobacteraceae bacterium IMCC9480]NDP59222.1 transposase [Oxalobacteraceae bacterium]